MCNKSVREHKDSQYQYRWCLHGCSYKCAAAKSIYYIFIFLCPADAKCNLSESNYL